MEPVTSVPVLEKLRSLSFVGREHISSDLLEEISTLCESTSTVHPESLETASMKEAAGISPPDTVANYLLDALLLGDTNFYPKQFDSGLGTDYSVAWNGLTGKYGEELRTLHFLTEHGHAGAVAKLQEALEQAKAGLI